jgi:hypothetical protein
MSIHRVMTVTLLFASACGGTSLSLDPRFASNARELPMSPFSGTWPPGEVTMGAYRASAITLDTKGSFTIATPGTETRIGGNWYEHAKLDGPGGKSAELSCAGPQAAPRDGDKWLHVSINVREFGCAMKGAASWTLRGGDPQARVVGIRTQEKTPPTFIVRDETGKELTVVKAQQTVSFGNAGGEYVMRDGAIVGALDTTTMAQPRAWVAQGLAPEDEFLISSIIATVYLLSPEVRAAECTPERHKALLC